MRRNFPFAILCIVLFTRTWSQTITPVPVDPSLVPTPPFSHNGLIIVSGAYGSGSIIGEGVLATAGHVVYDESVHQWIAASQVHYYPQSDTNSTLFNRTNYAPVALYRWSEYSTRVQNDDSGPGLSTPDTFNLDFAVGYFSSSITDLSVEQHAELHIDGDAEISIIRHPREKMVVGYPQSTVPFENRGLMHLTQPADYEGYDAIYEDLDSGGLWASVYNLDGVTTYSGASGGPVYVRDDMNNWMMAAVVDGSNGSTGMLVRSIDDNAWYGTEAPGLIRQAITARNGNALMRVEDLQSGQTGAHSVELTWTDESTQEMGYYVYRQEQGTYVQLAELPANTESFVDPGVKNGHVYHYQIQPYNAIGNKAPKSRPASVTISGIHQDAAAFLGSDYLKLTTTGDSSWHVDANNKLRAGLVRSMGSSSLVLDIIGPGMVAFDWSVSCEENPEYSTPGAQYEGDIYDAIRLYMDDVQVESGAEPVFLSGPAEEDPTGLKGPVNVQFSVPAGPHRIEWRYQKDPYANHHQDTGFLDSMTWQPDAASPYPVFGAYGVSGSTWHGSEWFGMYDAGLIPWTAHMDMGWLYLIGGTGPGGLYFNIPALGTLYTSPQIWPFLYRVDTESWLYYFVGSGSWGTDVYFYDYATSQRIQINN